MHSQTKYTVYIKLQFVPHLRHRRCMNTWHFHETVSFLTSAPAQITTKFSSYGKRMFIISFTKVAAISLRLLWTRYVTRTRVKEGKAFKISEMTTVRCTLGRWQWGARIWLLVVSNDINDVRTPYFIVRTVSQKSNFKILLPHFKHRVSVKMKPTCTYQHT